MYNMRESWADGRLDDFAKHVDHRFDALQRTLLQVGGGVIAALIAGFLGVIATQL